MFERSVLVEQINDMLFRHQTKILKYDEKAQWSLAEKKEFIMDILNGYPIGEFILSMTINNDTGRVKYKVINGNKRINAIIDFVENKFSINAIGEELSFSDLKENHRNLVKHFCQYKIPVEIVYTEDQEELKKIIEKQ